MDIDHEAAKILYDAPRIALGTDRGENQNEVKTNRPSQPFCFDSIDRPNVHATSIRSLSNSHVSLWLWDRNRERSVHVAQSCATGESPLDKAGCLKQKWIEPRMLQWGHNSWLGGQMCMRLCVRAENEAIQHRETCREVRVNPGKTRGPWPRDATLDACMLGKLY